MNIAAYCRVSTDKEDQLNSLETQKKFFEEYAERQGHTLVKIYADEGLSGTKLKIRKQFQQMLVDAEAGLFQMVAVKDISRFARNTVDFLQSIRKLKALGVETQFITASMTNMGDSEFILTIFAALAQEESANTSKRIKFTKKINGEKGRIPNIVYGYDKTKGDYFDLTINEREADIVREIYHMYVDQGMGAWRIAKELNSRGLKTKRGHDWSQEGITRIVSNELYTGIVINGKEEVADFLTGQRVKKDETEWSVVERPHLRIVDQELFDMAQECRQERSKRWPTRGERHSGKHLFSTLIKCGDCGATFRRMVKQYRNTYIRWVCTSRNLYGANSCVNATAVDESELIEALNHYFAGLLNDKDGVISYVVNEFKRVYEERDENEQQEQKLRDRLAKLNRTRQKYIDMYTNDLITMSELNKYIGGAKAEIDQIERDLQLLSYNISKSDQVEEVVRNTFKILENFTDVRELNNTQLKQIIDKIVVDHDGNVDVYLKVFGHITADENTTVLIHHNGTNSVDSLERFIWMIK